MGNSSNNIFLTTENLAFALPLISVCLCYVYFKYIPLPYALSILAMIAVIYQIRSYFKAHKAKKLTHLDDVMVRELAGEDEDRDLELKKQQQLKQRKAQAKLEQRLAQEKKLQQKKQQTTATTNNNNNNNNKKQQKEQSPNTEEVDDDDDELVMFAKGSRDVLKKKK